MKKVSSRYTIYLIMGITVVITTIIGCSYAIFRKATSQNSTNVISTLDCVEVSIVGNNDALNIQNGYPLTYGEAMKTQPYRFTVENQCNTYVEYQIVMSVVSTTISNNEYVKVDLDGLTYNKNKMLSELIEEPQQGLVGYLNNYTLITSAFDGNESHVYNFRMWLNADNEDIWEDENIANQNITVKLSIIGVTKTKYSYPTLSDTILAQEGGAGNIEAKGNPVTAPGREIAETNEGLFATPDDYGISYYYRGAVENNYVEFANKCWRIVRITGDGSIKLVLYNDNPNNVSETPCEVEDPTAAFARWRTGTGSTPYTTAFNTSYIYNAFVGFMYGTPGSSSYAYEHANSTPSAILQALQSWYNANSLSTYASYLADSIWCNDKSVDTVYVYGTTNGFGIYETGYGARGRIYAGGNYATQANPTLVCPNDKNGGKLSKFTVNDTENGNGALSNIEGYPPGLGLLTADEVAFAGGIYSTQNQNYYLNKNASSHWWTSSPYLFTGSHAAGVWSVGSTGSHNNYVSDSRALRPAVSLKSTVTATGEGTSTNPYKVTQQTLTLKDIILADEGGPAVIEAKGNPEPKPGRAVATTNEGLLAAPDDYGISYYFRGAVENNYVEFAGKCWRIVRVTGDGSIKLVLYNDNPNNASETPCEVEDQTAAFARHTGSTYTTKFNTSYNYNAYVGFMYGTPGSSSYADEHANSTPSTILQALQSWYNANSLSTYASYLADSIWCNDKSVDTVYVFGTTNGFGTHQTGYGARGRIYAGGNYATQANPTLECPNDKNGGNLSRFTVNDTENGNGALSNIEGYPPGLGLLTADEVAFAGGIYNTQNQNYYLNKNASSTYWWTLSPSYFNGSIARVWYVHSTGYLNNYNVDIGGVLRPAVSLKSTVTATGTGSSTNPYKITGLGA